MASVHEVPAGSAVGVSPSNFFGVKTMPAIAPATFPVDSSVRSMINVSSAGSNVRTLPGGRKVKLPVSSIVTVSGMGAGSVAAGWRDGVGNIFLILPMDGKQPLVQPICHPLHQRRAEEKAWRTQGHRHGTSCSPTSSDVSARSTPAAEAESDDPGPGRRALTAALSPHPLPTSRPF